MSLKDLAEFLSAIASTIAIIGVAVAWYQSARKPLKISRVVIHLHQQKSGATFILVFRNVKAFPVTIYRCDAYTQKKHEVQKKLGGRVEYSARFSSNDVIFNSKPDFEVAANGYTDLRIEVDYDDPPIPERILFLLETSHGYQEVKCKRITSVEMGKVQTYSLEYQYRSGSAIKARAFYLWKLLLELGK